MAFYAPVHVGSRAAGTDHRARTELDELEEQLVRQSAAVRVERDELAVAEKALERMSDQLADERASASPTCEQVGGQAVMPVPHRAPDVEDAALPPDYQRIVAVVRQAAGPVMARQVGEVLGVDVSVRAKLEPLRGKLVRLADRGWLLKMPDGRFTIRLCWCLSVQLAAPRGPGWVRTECTRGPCAGPQAPHTVPPGAGQARWIFQRVTSAARLK